MPSVKARRLSNMARDGPTAHRLVAGGFLHFESFKYDTRSLHKKRDVREGVVKNYPLPL